MSLFAFSSVRPLLLVAAAALSSLTCSMPSRAQERADDKAPHFEHEMSIKGKLAHVIATPAGLLVGFERSRTAAACAVSGSTFILVPQADSAMTYAVMAAWTSTARVVTIRVEPYTLTPPRNPYILDRGTNYCTAMYVRLD